MENDNIKLDVLDDFPEIKNYIKYLQKKIAKQERKINKLRKVIDQFKSNENAQDTATQTDLIDSDECSRNNTEDVKTKSIIEDITEAAEKAVQDSGFVYEATSGLYFDYKTGYYYNAEYGLYYDGNTGIYYKYNETTKEYEFYSQVSRSDLDKEEGIKLEKQKKSDHLNKEEYSITLEDGECSNSSESSSTNSEDNFSSTHSCKDIKEWPPCMRILIQETTVESLRQGMLFIVTCDGGTMGREGEHSVLIPDIAVSKHHAKFIYDAEDKQYKIIDFGSRNGTLLNGVRISAAKQESDPVNIVHGSVIQVGGTKLLCHIHTNHETCGHCEPGLLQIEKQKVEILHLKSRRKQHRDELKRLKQKFGVTSEVYVNVAKGYKDRAQIRRVTVGSQDHNEKTQIASMEQSIASDNKGFKLLSQMGWEEGKSLGKLGSGLKEPIPLTSNVGTTGLGFIQNCDPQIDKSIMKKQDKCKKMLERYENT